MGLARLIFVLSGGAAFGLDNPVIPRLADSGMTKFNGEYSIMGTGSKGCLYHSTDLVHWDGPHPVYHIANEWLTREQAQDHEIHACDLLYWNGVHHLYWSVNRPEIRQIAHAVSDGPRGPYHEPERAHWFDGRIDPHLFVDDDGQCYFYTVKFKGGNRISGQCMLDPWTLTGNPVELLNALPGTWENLDPPGYLVNEAPWVLRNRDRYYLLYNANHTAARFGNYAVGCAVAEGPLEFQNADKYPEPVLRGNWERILKASTIIVPLSSARDGQRWRMHLENPGESWAGENFRDDSWQEAMGAFSGGDSELPQANTHTSWTSPEIWLRKPFDLPSALCPKVRLLLWHDGDVEVFLNGVRAFQEKGTRWSYGLFAVESAAQAALHPGRNVLAVHCRKKGAAARCVDAGLLAPHGDCPDEIISNPGQVSVVRGLNGFEWWMAYFAVFNGSPRSQAVDRVFFFDRRLFVDGPTERTTSGYHPEPSEPLFRDLFDRSSEQDLGRNWTLASGQWRLEEQTLRQTLVTGQHDLALTVAPGTHYLFETAVRLDGTEAKEAGIFAVAKDAKNWLRVGLDAHARSWCYRLCRDGKPERRDFALARDFRFDAWHGVGVQKNAGRFEVLLDGRPAPGEGCIEADWAGPASVGLYTADAACSFDGVLCSTGWDEYGPDIRGWADGAVGSKASGVWLAGTQGLAQTQTGAGECRVFKGDTMAEYECMAQVSWEAGKGESDRVSVGMYAVFAGEAHWLRVELDSGLRQVRAVGRRGGKECVWWAQPLPDGSSFNLRTVKRRDVVHVFLDGGELPLVEGDWPDSQVGLWTRNGMARFNGITCFTVGHNRLSVSVTEESAP